MMTAISPQPRDRDPQERVGSMKTIAAINICSGIFSFIYHVWGCIKIIQDPKYIEMTGQTEEMVVYIGLTIMILISLILIFVSWKLFNRMAMIRNERQAVLRSCKCWKRWLSSFLTFFVISMMVMVLSSGPKVHSGVLQNYMAGILIFITFTIYGIYNTGKMIHELNTYHHQHEEIDIPCSHVNVDNGTLVVLENVTNPSPETPDSSFIRVT